MLWIKHRCSLSSRWYTQAPTILVIQNGLWNFQSSFLLRWIVLM